MTLGKLKHRIRECLYYWMNMSDSSTETCSLPFRESVGQLLHTCSNLDKLVVVLLYIFSAVSLKLSAIPFMGIMPLDLPLVGNLV